MTPEQRAELGRLYSYGLALLTLDCGHHVFRQIIPPRARARCGLCLELYERERARWGI